MDILKPLIRHFFHDFFMRRDGYHVKPLLRALHESQYWPEDRIRESQLIKLKELLAFAYEFNSFYRTRFDEAGFNPADFRDFSDLAHLPRLSKDDIRSAGDALFSDGFDRTNAYHKRTGGSTGVPLHNYLDQAAVANKKAATMRHDGWAGLVPGCRVAAVWGDTDKKLNWRGHLRNMLMSRTIYLDTLKFDEPNIRQFLARIEKSRPEVMLGHAHSIFRLAEYCRDHGFNHIRFQGIITTAMVLSESERAVIEATFASPVYNRYGCEEISIIASECEAHAGMHIFAEGLFVELDGPDDGIPQPLMITDLLNKAMPMIRYEIGDYGVMQSGSCTCGRGLPRFREISGRTADFLYSPEGKPIFGISILDTFVIHIPGLKQVQIIQDRLDHIELFIVKDADFKQDSELKINQTVVEVFGLAMTFDLTYVDRIPQTERGKYRFSICKIKPNP